MKKNTIKAFTLVEMLIVIVIIGILIASLMPRMQSAQWRARDVARKNDLAQIQTAIITSQQDKWEWPKQSEATSGLSISDIEKELLRAGMSSVPVDPNKANTVNWLWKSWSGYEPWQYAYMVADRNWVKEWGFVLMAKTEVEWWSNWVYCDDSSKGLTWWYIGSEDLRNIQLCTSFDLDEDSTTSCTTNSGGAWKCVYNSVNQLRYILLY